MKKRSNLNKKSLVDILEKHFEDDKSSFSEIKHNQVKYQELLKINGEHFSAFGKNLAELRSELREQRVEFKEHMARVEPMLCAYERDTAFTKSLGERAKKWGTRITFLAAIIGATLYLKHFVINFLLK